MDGDVPTLLASGRRQPAGAGPWLLGVVPVPPRPVIAERLGRALAALGAGATIIELDVGRRPSGPVPDGRDRLEPVELLARRITAELGAVVAVHTRDPRIAGAAIAGGASILTGAGGPRLAELARLCARSGAALALSGTPVRGPRPGASAGTGTGGHALRTMREQAEVTLAAGLPGARLILDWTPALAEQARAAAGTARALAGDLTQLPAPAALLLVDLAPRQPPAAGPDGPAEEHGVELGATLALLARALDAGVRMVRTTDVASARDFLTVRAALAGELEPDSDLALAEEQRHEPAAVE